MASKENAVASAPEAVSVTPPVVDYPWMPADKPVIYMAPYYWEQMAAQNQEIYIKLFRVVLTPVHPPVVEGEVVVS